MESAPDASYALFGAEALLKRLQTLIQESAGVRRDEDVESVHRMRVASRRLRAALELFQDTLPRKKFAAWARQARRLTRALGAVRDADVQIAALEEGLGRLTEPRHRPGLARLRLRLRQSRARLRARALKALDGWDAAGHAGDMDRTLRQTLVRGRLNQVPAVSPPAIQLARAQISLRLEEFLSFESCVRKPERVEELHAMRIAAKRLRYTLEIFAPLDPDRFAAPLQAAREAQELLGDVHDGDVWAQCLPEFMEDEAARMLEYLGNARDFSRLARGLRYWQQDRRRCRNRRYRDFVQFWKRTQDAGVWERLRRVSSAPPAPGEPPPAAPPAPAETPA